MLYSIGKLAVVSAIAGLLVFLTADALKADAADGTSAQVQRVDKADRLPVFVKGTACSKRGWPNYEVACLFDDRTSADDVRAVRVIALR